MGIKLCNAEGYITARVPRCEEPPGRITSTQECREAKEIAKICLDCKKKKCKGGPCKRFRQVRAEIKQKKEEV